MRIVAVRLSEKSTLAAMNTGKVARALEDRNERVAAKARELLAAEEVEGEVSTSTGVRPKGRPYARTSLSNADQEFGTATTPRRRIMGRAATES